MLKYRKNENFVYLEKDISNRENAGTFKKPIDKIIKEMLQNYLDNNSEFNEIDIVETYISETKIILGCGLFK